MKEASTDPEARSVLEQMILEKLINEEAKARRIVVSDEEVEDYINNLAKRNELSRKAFEVALKQQKGKTIDVFKKEVAAQIQKSRLASELIKDGLAVSDAEIDDYLKEHQELGRDSGKIKLSQIMLLGTDERTRLKAEALRQEIKNGADFAETARKYSASPDAEEGGLLGVVDEKDLDPAVFEAVFSLAVGDVSEVVESPQGFHLFMVNDRMSAAKDSGKQKIRDEVSQILKQQKLEAKLQDFFNIELFSNYFVEKKI
jgi:parvulin-like peptidyl-prolyl isomerase